MLSLTAPRVAQPAPPVGQAAPMAASSMPATPYALALPKEPAHALAKVQPGPSPATGAGGVEAPPARRKAPPAPSPVGVDGVEVRPLARAKAKDAPSPAPAEEPARGRFRSKRQTKAPPEAAPKSEASEGPANRWPKAGPPYKVNEVQRAGRF